MLKWDTEEKSYHFPVNRKTLLVHLISSAFKSVGLASVSKDNAYVEYLSSAEFWEALPVTVGTTKNLLFSIAKNHLMNCIYVQVYLFCKVQ